MIKELAPAVESIALVAPPSAPASRAWKPREAEQFAKSLGVNASSVEDFRDAISSASKMDGTVLITGSFHTVGDALVELGEKTL